MKSTSYNEPLLVECTNKEKDIWVVRWDIKKVIGDIDSYYEYHEQRFNHIPSIAEIKHLITSWINSLVDEKILKGFQWNGYPVWLSQENQFNYKATHDLAIQTSGKSLPVKFKFGTDKDVHYVDFTTVEEITSFYQAALSHIQKSYMGGWDMKDDYNYSLYEKIINDNQQ